MSRSATPDGTCLHLLKPAQISRSPRDVLPLAQTSSDQLSLAQIHSDSSAASRKHVNFNVVNSFVVVVVVVIYVLTRRRRFIGVDLSKGKFVGGGLSKRRHGTWGAADLSWLEQMQASPVGGSGAAHLYVFYVSWRLLEAHLYVFYTLRAGPPTQLSLGRASF